MPNSIPTLSRDQIREFDRRAIHEFGIPGVVLMENAGRGVAQVLLELTSADSPTRDTRVAICCGKGNNGGDGFVIARHLQRHGIAVTLHCWQALDQWTDDAQINAAIAGRCGIETLFHAGSDWPSTLAVSLQDATWIVDALLGTGAIGTPRPPFDQAIAIMNNTPGQKLAVDIPSGLDCDTGQIGDPTFRADHTCTFVAPKPGLLFASAAAHVGQLHIVDIGAPQTLYGEMVGT